MITGVCHVPKQGSTLKSSSNWPKAEKILAAIGEKHALAASDEAEKLLGNIAEAIVFHKLTSRVYMKVRQEKPAGIKLTLRYLTRPRQSRNQENSMWQDILNAFGQESDIRLFFDL